MQEERILIVDDDAAIRRSLSTILENEGFVVSAAADAFEALALFDQGPAALTVTDLSMPGMHGLELLLRLRQRDPAAAIVVMTACGEVDSAVEAMRAGALDYLVKPLDVDRLLRTAETTLRGRELQRRSNPPCASESCGEDSAGSSAEMSADFRSIQQLASSERLPSVPGASMRELERYAILKTLEAVGGSTSKTASMLGMSVRKIQYRLRQYGARQPRSSAH